MKFLDQIDEAGREFVIAALLNDSGSIGKVHKLTGGKFGTIYKINYKDSDIDRVAKCPNFKKFDSKSDRKKVFEKAFYELEKTYHLRHNPWFNTFIDLRMIVNWPFFISRYWDCTLFDLIGNPKEWSLSDKIQVCLILLRGMITAQEVGIRSHQDLKPENVFINHFGKSLVGSSGENGIKYWPKIGDLGMADAFSAFGMNSASRPYQAPEQYSKDFIDEEAALKLDCFAFGVLFHEIFTDGIHPIGEKTRDVWPNPLNGQKKWTRENIWKNWANKENKNLDFLPCSLGPELKELILKMLSADPQRRPTLQDAFQDLTEIFSKVDMNRCDNVLMQIKYIEDTQQTQNLEDGSDWPHLFKMMIEARNFFSQL